MTPREAHGVLNSALSGGTNFPIPFASINLAMGLMMRGVEALEAAETLAPEQNNPAPKATPKAPAKKRPAKKGKKP